MKSDEYTFSFYKALNHWKIIHHSLKYANPERIDRLQRVYLSPIDRNFIIATKLGGGGGVYWIHPVCLSVCLSVCSLTFRVRPVASTVPDGFFPYFLQMINSMGGCVACDDPWPWPISSRSFGLDLENRVRSVASKVVDGFFLYLAQIITIIRGCVACYVFSESGNLNFWQIFKIVRPRPWKKSAVLDGFFPYVAQMITSMRVCVWPWPISSRSFGLGLENRVRSAASTIPDGFFPYVVQMITSIRRCVACNDLWPWPISSRSFDLVLTWDPTWLNSVGNHEAADGILRTQAF